MEQLKRNGIQSLYIILFTKINDKKSTQFIISIPSKLDEICINLFFIPFFNRKKYNIQKKEKLLINMDININILILGTFIPNIKILT